MVFPCPDTGIHRMASSDCAIHWVAPSERFGIPPPPRAAGPGGCFMHKPIAVSLRLIMCLPGLSLVGGLPAISPAAATDQAPRAESSRPASVSFRPALSFEANLGQAARDVRFQTRAAGYLALFSPDRVPLSLARPGMAGGPAARVRMNFIGARADARIEGLESRVARSHYYLGPDPARWVTDVPHYGRVRYDQLYPGIDLIFYGQPDDLEYDFAVAPGARPETIRIAFGGVKEIHIDGQGDLILETAAGTLRQHRPEIYQEVEGRRRPVEGGYELRGAGAIGFRVGRYDPGRPLVIDPSLVMSSYIGPAPGTDEITDVATDGEGNFYLTGW